MRGVKAMDTTKSITKSDITRIEASIKKLLKATKANQVDQEYVDMVHQLADTVNQIRLTVEFDHEQRINAIEEFLQDL
jgi:hypothetical protein